MARAPHGARAASRRLAAFIEGRVGARAALRYGVAMLVAAFVILAAAVLLGSGLAVLYLRTEGAVAPPWTLAAPHGLLAVAGLGCLALALRGPPRGLDQGMGSFGVIAAVLMASAAVLGGGFLARRLRRRPLAGMAVAVHATLAVSGFVILAVYVLAG